LIVVGGNPLVSWPNQAKTRRALESLELLVVVDPQVSATARLAHYVLGPRFGFETPAISFPNEGITTYGLSIGYQEPYAQYQPQLVEPPQGSEVLEDWRIFYELARRMGLALAYRGQPFDMERPPTTDDLLAQFVRRSRIPLETIKQHPHGYIYPDPEPLCAPKDPDWPHRLQLGDATMLAQLAEVAGRLQREDSSSVAANVTDTAEGTELLLVSRREHAVYNSVAHHLPALRRRRPFNPAYMNPADAARLGLEDGCKVTLQTRVGTIDAIVQCAPDVRAGVVSMAHGFDAEAGEGHATTSALVDDERDYEAITGLPRMSAIPVRVTRSSSPSS
jgi:anaerobic selenocysteine-containing dehydrogenase